MSDLTENEILDRLKQSLRSAATNCKEIAKLALGKLPAGGMNYSTLREDMKLAEGCCQQMTHYRENYKWNFLGSKVTEMRGFTLRLLDGSGKNYKYFLGIAEVFNALLAIAERLQHEATGTLGPVLPAPLPDPTERHRPVQSLWKRPEGVRQSAGGILLPPSYAGNC